jgi:thiamine-phosphate pyrophosphorylase
VSAAPVSGSLEASRSSRAGVPGGVVVVTDRRQASAPLPDVVSAAVDGGARWVLLREKDLPRPERMALAVRLRVVLAPAGGRLIVAGPDRLGGDAVHLAAADPPVAAGLVGRSCHDEAELASLTAEDYVTLSPVFASRSKPGYEPMGLDRFGALCAAAGRPVLALGGIETPRQVAACVEAGAAGVAVMGAAMRASDARALVAAMTKEFG